MRLTKIAIVLIAILSIIGLFIVYYITQESIELLTDRTNTNNLPIGQTDEPSFPDNTENRNNNDSIFSDSHEETTQTSAECITSQISYSASNFNKNISCNEFEENTCINQSITCAITITNLDEEYGGRVEILFEFFDEENTENLFYSRLLNNNISALESLVFQDTYTTEESTIDCRYKTEEMPKKEIC